MDIHGSLAIQDPVLVLDALIFLLVNYFLSIQVGIQPREGTHLKWNDSLYTG